MANGRHNYVARDRYSSRPGRLYVIGSPGLAAVKIGFTSGSVAKRLRDLQTGNPHRLELLADIPAVKGDEREMHIMLREYWVQGEWYEASSVFVRMLLAAANG
jgi:hypothetical protein